MAIAASAAAAPGDLLLALRGSGQALYVGLAEDAFIVASEPYGAGRGDRAATSAWTARRRPTPSNPSASRGQVVRARRRADAGDARRASSGWPTTAPPLPVDRRRAGDGPDHHPRHRPGRLPALPAEGDLRGAGVVPQDAAGQARRARRPARRSRSARRRLPADVARRACATARSAGCWSSARAPPPSPARAWPRRSTRSPPATRRCGSRPCWPPSCRASSCAATWPTPWWSPSASRAPPPTPTAPSTWSAARGAAVDRHRQPAQQRPHRQGRRRALHVRRPRRGDERRVDQGVLRPDRRRLPAGAAPSPSEVGRRPDRPRPSVLAALRELPDAMDAHARLPAGASPRPPSGSRRAAATGPSSATAPTASPPRRCGSSSPSSATSRSPATRTEDKKHIDLSSEPLILVCAAGLDRLDRRRRGQGGRDLPGPQGGARS